MIRSTGYNSAAISDPDQGQEGHSPPPSYTDDMPPSYESEMEGPTERLIEDEIDMENYDSDKNLSQEEGLDMKRAVLRWFAALGFAIMAVLYGCLAGTVVGTNDAMIASTKLELIEQVDRQAFSTLDEAGQYLTRLLNQYDQSVISYTAFSINNALRESPQFDQAHNVSNYWDDERGLSALCQPTAVDPPRFPSEQISKCASAAFLTNVNTGDLDTVQAGSNSPLANGIDAVNKTTVLDPFLIHMYDTNPDCYVIYAGFNTVPPLTRRYPGRATQIKTNGDIYNPTVRPWYTYAEENDGETVFTEPYQDYYTSDWMITGARTFYSYDVMSSYYSTSTGDTDPNNPNPYSSTALGVVGADILITTISEALGRIQFLSSGKLSLIRNTGQVIADNDWDIATSQSDFYYSDMSTPAVSSELWREISSTATGTTKTIKFSGDEIIDDDSDQEYTNIAFVKHLSDYDGQFLLVVFITTEEVYSPVKEAIDELTAINNTVLSALAVGLSVMALALILIMWYLLNSIMKTFHDIESNVEQLLRNVGQSDRQLGDNMVEIEPGASTELTQLSQTMNQMVESLQHNRGAQTVDLSEQEGEQVTLDSMWNLVPMGQSAHAAAEALPVASVVTPRSL